LKLLDALLGTKLHILDFFSDEMVDLCSKNYLKFKEVYYGIHIKMRHSIYDYGQACGIISGQCI
jgi:hypothetical protein